MKRLLITIIAVCVSTIVLAQQPETVLQPVEIITETTESSYYPEISHFEYDNSGALIGYTMYQEYIGAPWVSNADTLMFQYDNQNNMVNCDYNRQRPHWQFGSFWKMYEYLYNDNNQLEEVNSYRYYQHAPYIFERFVLAYDGQDRIVADTFYEKEEFWYEDMFPTQIRNYTYQENKKVTIRENFNLDGTPKYKYRITKTDTPEGTTQSVKWEKYNYTSNIYVNKALFNYIYTDNRLASVEIDAWDNENKWVNDRRSVYTRDANGRIILSDNQLWDGNSFANYTRAVYELNESGYPTSIQFEDYSAENNAWIPGDALLDYLFYDYVDYDIPNIQYFRHIDSIFPQQHLKFINDHCLIGLGTRFDISYVETPNPHYAVDEKEDIKAKIYPNPTNGIVNILGENIVNVEIVNIMGQTILSKKCDADETKIDISGLNSSVYLIKMRTKDGKEFAERIIKE